MMNENIKDITIALSGVVQAAVLVQQYATTGRYDEAAFDCSINSVYQIDAPDVKSIYGDYRGLKLGFYSLADLFSRAQKPADKEISRYVISLLHVQKQLMRDTKILNALKKKLAYATSQAEFFSTTHPTVIKSLGHIYSETISHLPFRIQIIGHKNIIASSESMDTLRALLLAGLRSAVLWQQVGGTKWQFLFQRRRLAECARGLMKAL